MFYNGVFVFFVFSSDVINLLKKSALGKVLSERIDQTDRYGENGPEKYTFSMPAAIDKTHLDNIYQFIFKQYKNYS